LNELVVQIRNSNQIFLILALVLGLLNISLQYFKWKITLRAMLDITDNKKILSSLLQGLSAALSTPARLGEYVGRALPFADKSFLQVTLATLVDKFFSVLIVILFGSLASLLFIHIHYQVFEFISLSFLILVLLFTYLILLLLFNESFWDNFLFNKIKVSKKFGKYYNKFEVLRRLDKSYKYKMLFLSFIFYLCIITQYALLVMSFSLKHNFLDYMWVGNMIMYTKTIIPSITLGEIGIREIASVYFIQRVGENPTVGFNASIFLFIINIVIPALVGIVYQLYKNND
jgi:uncharacterized protein (TIRG00374 family)